jgi:hypothetical protein
VQLHVRSTIVLALNDDTFSMKENSVGKYEMMIFPYIGKLPEFEWAFLGDVNDLATETELTGL